MIFFRLVPPGPTSFPRLCTGTSNFSLTGQLLFFGCLRKTTSRPYIRIYIFFKSYKKKKICYVQVPIISQILHGFKYWLRLKVLLMLSKKEDTFYYYSRCWGGVCQTDAAPFIISPLQIAGTLSRTFIMPLYGACFTDIGMCNT